MSVATDGALHSAVPGSSSGVYGHGGDALTVQQQQERHHTIATETKSLAAFADHLADKVVTLEDTVEAALVPLAQMASNEGHGVLQSKAQPGSSIENAPPARTEGLASHEMHSERSDAVPGPSGRSHVSVASAGARNISERSVPDTDQPQSEERLSETSEPPHPAPSTRGHSHVSVEGVSVREHISEHHGVQSHHSVSQASDGQGRRPVVSGSATQHSAGHSYNPQLHPQEHRSELSEPRDVQSRHSASQVTPSHSHATVNATAENASDHISQPYGDRSHHSISQVSHGRNYSGTIEHGVRNVSERSGEHSGQPPVQHLRDVSEPRNDVQSVRDASASQATPEASEVPISGVATNVSDRMPDGLGVTDRSRQSISQHASLQPSIGHSHSHNGDDGGDYERTPSAAVAPALSERNVLSHSQPNSAGETTGGNDGNFTAPAGYAYVSPKMLKAHPIYRAQVAKDDPHYYTRSGPSNASEGDRDGDNGGDGVGPRRPSIDGVYGDTDNLSSPSQSSIAAVDVRRHIEHARRAAGDLNESPIPVSVEGQSHSPMHAGSTAHTPGSGVARSSMAQASAEKSFVEQIHQRTSGLMKRFKETATLLDDVREQQKVLSRVAGHDSK
eukprot:GFYU01008841.1.p1 GENE.GFYU01008841.1~~GFYU01008841.1.p1  ORF type:complete len:660 (-),score=89.04 GFYU01008841.1:19-1872(-)